MASTHADLAGLPCHSQPPATFRRSGKWSLTGTKRLTRFISELWMLVVWPRAWCVTGDDSRMRYVVTSPFDGGQELFQERALRRRLTRFATSVGSPIDPWCGGDVGQQPIRPAGAYGPFLCYSAAATASVA
jgi:hypothetical protein